MAVNFQHPFQCIQSIERQPSGSQSLLIGSAGPRIYSYVAQTGKRLAVWPHDVESTSSENPKVANEEPNSETQAPPEKKRKVTSGNGTNESKSTDDASGAWSTIPMLAVSSNEEYVVALTGEDKTIRVLKLEEDGSLHQLSARCMPKRPSAIALTCNDTTILSADKFGDVYSIPLLPGGNPVPSQRNPRQAKLSGPSASNLTVHSKRNLIALEQQLKTPRDPDQQKSGPDFEHHLILGHVSLLTDLVVASLETSGGMRSYILTADRDEHIRVSRGLPQAHVIENYCLGHTSFISSLCIPRFSPDILISGGGDNFLLVWKWLEGRVLQKVSLADQSPENTELAVRGIWAVPLADSADSFKVLNVILVAIEGFSQLRSYVLGPSGTLKSQGHIQLSGNVLSVTSLEKDGIVIVSVDGVREAGSTDTWRTSPSGQALVEAFRVKSGKNLQWESATDDTLASTVNSQGTSDIPADIQQRQRNEMKDALYGLGNLRKKNTGGEE